MSTPYSGLTQIVTGAQIGFEQAALTIANSCGIKVLGTMPPGCILEDGKAHLDIASCYKLDAMPDDSDLSYIEQNVLDADATLLLTNSAKASENAAFIKAQHAAESFNKPLLLGMMYDNWPAAAQLRMWILRNKINSLYITGPSNEGSILSTTQSYLLSAFQYRYAYLVGDNTGYGVVEMVNSDGNPVRWIINYQPYLPRDRRENQYVSVNPLCPSFKYSTLAAETVNDFISALGLKFITDPAPWSTARDTDGLV